MAHDYLEKRDFVRIKLDCDIDLKMHQGKRQFTARARDLSAKGVLFHTSEILECGDQLDLHLESGQALLSVLDADIEVVRVVLLGAGEYAVGSLIHSIAGSAQ
ncbi:MAG: PilZ domain-containing protein [Gammaproteobacteria bacterium]